MELRHLRYFVSLADCLSFTRAAARVHVTQSTLSHQIKQLEDHFGLSLFERKSQPLKLSPAGQRLHLLAERMLPRRSAPVQIQNYDDAVGVQDVHPGQDRRPITGGRPVVGRVST